jgi:hypothetical protein
MFALFVNILNYFVLFVLYLLNYGYVEFVFFYIISVKDMLDYFFSIQERLRFAFSPLNM